MSSGIYAITNIQTNKRYIGSSSNIRKRIVKHRYNLRHFIHTNKKLQNAWAKYGESCFRFDVLDYCATEELITCEQQWITSTHPHYNLKTTAGSMLGFKHTEESKAKISAYKKGKPAYNASLTKEQAQEIRNRYGPPRGQGANGHGLITVRQLAQEYEVGSDCIQKIIKNRYYLINDHEGLLSHRRGTTNNES